MADASRSGLKTLPNHDRRRPTLEYERRQRPTMDRVRMSTVVYTPPSTVYEFLLDFPGYRKYSEYVKEIHADGDGGVGTEYGITFGWWKVTYLAQSRVVGLAPPERIDWEIIKDIDARGSWLVEPVDPPEGHTAATRVTIDVEFDSDSVSAGAIDLPRFVNVSWLVEKAVPLIVRQARSVLRGVVTDLEGEPREVELTVHETPKTVDVDAEDLDVTGADGDDGDATAGP
jgi:hypothetical protein